MIDELLNKMLGSKDRLEKMIKEAKTLHGLSIATTREMISKMEDGSDKDLLKSELDRVLESKTQSDYTGAIQRIEAIIRKINADR